MVKILLSNELLNKAETARLSGFCFIICVIPIFFGWFGSGVKKNLNR